MASKSSDCQVCFCQSDRCLFFCFCVGVEKSDVGEEADHAMDYTQGAHRIICVFDAVQECVLACVHQCFPLKCVILEKMLVAKTWTRIFPVHKIIKRVAILWLKVHCLTKVSVLWVKYVYQLVPVINVTLVEGGVSSFVITGLYENKRNETSSINSGVFCAAVRVKHFFVQV